MLSILADVLLIATGQTPAKHADFYHADRQPRLTDRAAPRAEKVK